MAQIKLTIRAEAPLSLGATKAYGGTLIETGLYVAGAQLRGALGALKNYASEQERQELDRLLGTGQEAGVNFPNCYLTNDPDRLSLPTPLTAQTCKRKPGLKGEGNGKNKPHGVADTLLRQLAYDHVAGEGDGPRRIPLPFQYKCPECGHRTEDYTRIVERRGPHEYAEARLSAHRQTRVAINRARLTAEEGLLYSVRAIDEGSTFTGLLQVDDEEQKRLLLKWLSQLARIGGRTSRGFGKVKVTVEDARQELSLRDRLEDFNEQYRKFEADLSTLAIDPPPEETRMLFTINLHAEALLRDTLGLPTLRLDEALLRAALADLVTDEEQQVLREIRFERRAQFILPQQVSGWQTAWKLPKEVLLAAQTGGLYVFAADVGQDQELKEKLIAWLGRLEVASIGEMRADGFGQIAICDPFHLEVEPV